ncbi:MULTISPECIES: DUF4321 domain-containing protein [Paenibacillus]|uniref:DUF4321 domain-containing protein n=2 Tax=Paenibacillus TaxID=44249 RepID=A0ABS5C6C8_9BACL|nr:MULTISPECIES: DUF4321 domain-containing protein [Paenibacillus]MBP3961410.1 DUF4321 domain-containing protein [Paenibacillus lignilyticus]SDX40503.1 protein of unknown function [Paenibacillus sp. CF384]SFS58320.1 protein of unknown function [Paenibacillus sp. BC26]
MKKNFWVLLLFILIGLLTGALVSRWLSQVPGLAFLTKTSPVVWSPAADLLVLSYSFTLRIEISLLSIIGLIAAIWIYRKL